jgi:hypothetical protein
LETRTEVSTTRFSAARIPRDLGIGQRVRAPPRIEACLVQHLVGDPVAHAGREALIEEQRLEGRRARRARGSRNRAKGGRPRCASKPSRLMGGSLAGSRRSRMRPRRRASATHELAAVVEDEMELGEARWPRVLGFLAVDSSFTRGPPGAVWKPPVMPK